MYVTCGGDRSGDITATTDWNLSVTTCLFTACALNEKEEGLNKNELHTTGKASFDDYSGHK